MYVYLLDVYCLRQERDGARHDGRAGAASTRRPCLQRLRNTTHPAPIDLVRELVLGAAEYARQLGFAPHPDLEQARPHLGPTGPGAITFGRNGKPTYISGPHDDTDRIIRTLQRAVGRTGFNSTIGVERSAGFPRSTPSASEATGGGTWSRSRRIAPTGPVVRRCTPASSPRVRGPKADRPCWRAAELLALSDRHAQPRCAHSLRPAAHVFRRRSRAPGQNVDVSRQS